MIDNYDLFPNNIVLSAFSSILALITAPGVDPYVTGIILPVVLFAAGKLADFAFRLWREKKRR